MINTSLGYHTFAFFQKTEGNEFNELSIDFMFYAGKNKDMKRFPVKNKIGKVIGWEYSYKKNKGIRWIVSSFEVSNGYTIQGVKVIINPKALIEKNYIVAAQENDTEIIENLYNDEAAKISPILLKFGSCSMNRADHCLNIDLEELGIPCTPRQMMSLVKQGKIPKHYEERKEYYDKKQHRKTADKNSFYLESKSCVMNFYWKYPKQNEKHPNYSFKELSRNVIRFEVQCKYPKLYNLSQNIRHKSKFYMLDIEIPVEDLYENLTQEICTPTIPIDVMLSGEISDKIVQEYLYKVIRKGDYFTLNGAKEIVESYNFRRDKEERIIYTLKLVNKYRGITKAKDKVDSWDLDDFNRSLKDLDDMLVNPITIPRRWNIEHIPNPLRAYYNNLYEEQVLFNREYLAEKHIDEFLKQND